MSLSQNILKQLYSTHVCSKYKALESLLEETVTNTMSIKEEKIAALESRLDWCLLKNYTACNCTGGRFDNIFLCAINLILC